MPKKRGRPCKRKFSAATEADSPDADEKDKADDLTVKKCGKSAVELSWKASPITCRYKVLYREFREIEWKPAGFTDNTKACITGMSDVVGYEYRILAEPGERRTRSLSQGRRFKQAPGSPRVSDEVPIFDISAGAVRREAVVSVNQLSVSQDEEAGDGLGDVKDETSNLCDETGGDDHGDERIEACDDHSDVSTEAGDDCGDERIEAGDDHGDASTEAGDDLGDASTEARGDHGDVNDKAGGDYGDVSDNTGDHGGCMDEGNRVQSDVGLNDHHGDDHDHSDSDQYHSRNACDAGGVDADVEENISAHTTPKSPLASADQQQPSSSSDTPLLTLSNLGSVDSGHREGDINEENGKPSVAIKKKRGRPRKPRVVKMNGSKEGAQDMQKADSALLSPDQSRSSPSSSDKAFTPYSSSVIDDLSVTLPTSSSPIIPTLSPRSDDVQPRQEEPVDRCASDASMTGQANLKSPLVDVIESHVPTNDGGSSVESSEDKEMTKEISPKPDCEKLEEPVTEPVLAQYVSRQQSRMSLVNEDNVFLFDELESEEAFQPDYFEELAEEDSEDDKVETSEETAASPEDPVESPETNRNRKAVNSVDSTYHREKTLTVKVPEDFRHLLSFSQGMSKISSSSEGIPAASVSSGTSTPIDTVKDASPSTDKFLSQPVVAPEKVSSARETPSQKMKAKDQTVKAGKTKPKNDSTATVKKTAQEKDIEILVDESVAGTVKAADAASTNDKHESRVAENLKSSKRPVKEKDTSSGEVVLVHGESTSFSLDIQSHNKTTSPQTSPTVKKEDKESKKKRKELASEKNKAAKLPGEVKETKSAEKDQSLTKKSSPVTPVQKSLESNVLTPQPVDSSGVETLACSEQSSSSSTLAKQSKEATAVEKSRASHDAPVSSKAHRKSEKKEKKSKTKSPSEKKLSELPKSAVSSDKKQEENTERSKSISHAFSSLNEQSQAQNSLGSKSINIKRKEKTENPEHAVKKPKLSRPSVEQNSGSSHNEKPSIAKRPWNKKTFQSTDNAVLEKRKSLDSSKSSGVGSKDLSGKRRIDRKSHAAEQVQAVKATPASSASGKAVSSPGASLKATSTSTASTKAESSSVKVSSASVALGKGLSIPSTSVKAETFSEALVKAVSVSAALVKAPSASPASTKAASRSVKAPSASPASAKAASTSVKAPSASPASAKASSASVKAPPASPASAKAASASGASVRAALSSGASVRAALSSGASVKTASSSGASVKAASSSGAAVKAASTSIASVKSASPSVSCKAVPSSAASAKASSPSVASMKSSPVDVASVKTATDDIKNVPPSKIDSAKLKAANVKSLLTAGADVPPRTVQIHPSKDKEKRIVKKVKAIKLPTGGLKIVKIIEEHVEDGKASHVVKKQKPPTVQVVKPQPIPQVVKPTTASSSISSNRDEPAGNASQGQGHPPRGHNIATDTVSERGRTNQLPDVAISSSSTPQTSSVASPAMPGRRSSAVVMDSTSDRSEQRPAVAVTSHGNDSHQHEGFSVSENRSVAESLHVELSRDKPFADLRQKLNTKTRPPPGGDSANKEMLVPSEAQHKQPTDTFALRKWVKKIILFETEFSSVVLNQYDRIQHHDDPGDICAARIHALGKAKDWKNLGAFAARMTWKQGCVVDSRLECLKLCLISSTLKVRINFSHLVEGFEDALGSSTDEDSCSWLASLGVRLLQWCTLNKKYDQAADLLLYMHQHGLDYNKCGMLSLHEMASLVSVILAKANQLERIITVLDFTDWYSVPVAAEYNAHERRGRLISLAEISRVVALKLGHKGASMATDVQELLMKLLRDLLSRMLNEWNQDLSGLWNRAIDLSCELKMPYSLTALVDLNNEKTASDLHWLPLVLQNTFRYLYDLKSSKSYFFYKACTLVSQAINEGLFPRQSEDQFNAERRLLHVTVASRMSAEDMYLLLFSSLCKLLDADGKIDVRGLSFSIDDCVQNSHGNPLDGEQELEKLLTQGIRPAVRWHRTSSGVYHVLPTTLKPFVDTIPQHYDALHAMCEEASEVNSDQLPTAPVDEALPINTDLTGDSSLSFTDNLEKREVEGTKCLLPNPNELDIGSSSAQEETDISFSDENRLHQESPLHVPKRSVVSSLPPNKKRKADVDYRVMGPLGEPTYIPAQSSPKKNMFPSYDRKEGVADSTQGFGEPTSGHEWPVHSVDQEQPANVQAEHFVSHEHGPQVFHQNSEQFVEEPEVVMEYVEDENSHGYTEQNVMGEEEVYNEQEGFFQPKAFNENEGFHEEFETYEENIVGNENEVYAGGNFNEGQEIHYEQEQQEHFEDDNNQYCEGHENYEGHAEFGEGHTDFGEGHTEFTEGHAEFTEGHAELTEGHAEFVEGHAEFTEGHLEFTEGLNQFEDHTETHIYADNPEVHHQEGQEFYDDYAEGGDEYVAEDAWFEGHESHHEGQMIADAGHFSVGQGVHHGGLNTVAADYDQASETYTEAGSYVQESAGLMHDVESHEPELHHAGLESPTLPTEGKPFNRPWQPKQWRGRGRGIARGGYRGAGQGVPPPLKKPLLSTPPPASESTPLYSEMQHHPSQNHIPITGEPLHVGPPYPPGKPSHPSWKQPQLSGKPPHLSGKPPHLSGEPPHPSGKSTHLPGKPSQLPGKQTHPSGKLLHPTGKPPYSSGKQPYLPGKPQHLPGKPPHLHRKPSPFPVKPPLVAGKPPHLSGNPTPPSGKLAPLSGNTSDLRERSYTPPGNPFSDKSFSSRKPNLQSEQPNLRAGKQDLQASEPTLRAGKQNLQAGKQNQRAGKQNQGAGKPGPSRHPPQSEHPHPYSVKKTPYFTEKRLPQTQEQHAPVLRRPTPNITMHNRSVKTAFTGSSHSDTTEQQIPSLLEGAFLSKPSEQLDANEFDMNEANSSQPHTNPVKLQQPPANTAPHKKYNPDLYKKVHEAVCDRMKFHSKEEGVTFGAFVKTAHFWCRGFLNINIGLTRLSDDAFERLVKFVDKKVKQMC